MREACLASCWTSSNVFPTIDSPFMLRRMSPVCRMPVAAAIPDTLADRG